MESRLIEGFEHSPIQNAPGAQANPQRINVASIDPDFVVKMRPGREPRRADIGNRLSLMHARAYAKPRWYAGDMGVGRLIPEIMEDSDILPVAPFQTVDREEG